MNNWEPLFGQEELVEMVLSVASGTQVVGSVERALEPIFAGFVPLVFYPNMDSN